MIYKSWIFSINKYPKDTNKRLFFITKSLIINQHLIQIKLTRQLLGNMSILSQQIERLFTKHLNLLCPICHQPYNLQENSPIIVCQSGQHHCCQECVSLKIFSNNVTRADCPLCRARINSKNTIKFRMFEDIFSLKEELIEVCRSFEENSEIKVNNAIEDVLGYKKQEQQQDLYKPHKITKRYYQPKQPQTVQGILMKEIYLLHQQSKIEKLISISKQVIQTGMASTHHFQAIGHRQAHAGYDQTHIRENYRDKIFKVGVINTYDLLSYCLMLSVDYDEDLVWFHTALKKHPKNPQLWYIYGIFQSNCNHKLQAVQAYKKAFALNNNLPNIQQWIAFQYYTLGQLVLARSYALRSLDRNPSNVYSRFIKIMTEEDDNKIIQSLQQLVKQNQSYLVPRHQLGQIYFNNCSYDKALKCYLECIDRSKFYDSPKIGAARCYIELKMPEKAIEILEEYIKEIGDDQSEEPYLILAFAYKEVQQFKKAFEMIEIARKKNPINEKINLLQAEVYVKEQKYGLAIDTLLDILKRDPNEIQTIKYTATIYLKMGQLSNAENWSQIYKKHKPLDLQLDFNFAQFYLQHKEYQKALQTYEKLLENEGVESEVYPKIISIYTELGQYDEALRQSRKWSEEEPHNPCSWEKISEITLLISTKIRNKQWEPKKYRRDK